MTIYKKLIHCSAAWYVWIMFLIFPLYMTDHYFNMLSDKVFFFKHCTDIFFAWILSLTVLLCLIRIKECRDAYQTISFQMIREFLMKRITLGDILFGVFIVIVGISAYVSPYRQQALTGDDGRFQGAYMWLRYAMAYSIIRWGYRKQKKPLIWFTIIGIIFAFWGILDFCGLDIFGWISEVKEKQRGMFTSVFGNINTYTQALALYAGITSVLLSQSINDKKRHWSIGFTVMLTVLFTGLITGQSDNAVIGIAIVMLLSIIVSSMIKDSNQCVAYHMLALAAAFSLSWMLQKSFDNPYIGENAGILLILSRNLYVIGVLWLGAGTLFLLSWLCRKGNHTVWNMTTWIYQHWWLLPIIAAAAGIGMAYAVSRGTFSDNSTLNNIFLFNDRWGTNRGYAWRATIEEFAALSPVHQFIGNGAETFGLVVKAARKEEMVAFMGSVFDSPHNEFLQTLFSFGVLGFLSYYGTIVFHIRRAYQSKKWIRMAAAGGVIAYLAVSTISISVPIVMPYVIILLAISANSAVTENILQRQIQ